MEFKDARELFTAVNRGQVKGSNRIYYNRETGQFFPKGKLGHYGVQCKLLICKFLTIILPPYHDPHSLYRRLEKYQITHLNASNYINAISSIHVPENKIITATSLKKIISEYGLSNIDYKILSS
jgi:hypothetical protein